MAIPTANITENYDALKILRETHLNTAMSYIETQFNTYTKLNFDQIALDVFGVSYTFDNDGVANRGTALVDAVATLAENETVTGAWTFSGALTLSNTVTSSSSFTATGQPRCRVYLDSAVQVINDATITAINFNSESFDVGAMHDNSVSNNRITIPSGGDGVYSISGCVNFEASVTGKREIYIYKNNSVIATAKQNANSATETTILNIDILDTAAAADYYELRVYQNSSGGLDVNNGAAVTFFSAVKNW